jgi:hypothetical protein
MNSKYYAIALGAVAALALAEAVSANNLAVDWWTIDCGGEMWSTGGDLELSGTLGQPDASGVVLTGGDLLLTGGFWPAAGSAPVWCLGDADCSGGAPDFLDIEYFVAALSGEASWSAYYQDHHGGTLPACPYAVNDLNGGGVEFTDIEPFVRHLGQACNPM